MRPLSVAERTALVRRSRAQAEPAGGVARAKALVAGAARHGGGQPKGSTARAPDRILRDVRPTPDRDHDGTASWSLSPLHRVRRRAADGLPSVSTVPIWAVVPDAALRWGWDRSWCPTGTAGRPRPRGTVTVSDPDAVAKKT